MPDVGSSSPSTPVLLARFPVVPIAVGHCSGGQGEPALLAAGRDGRLCVYGARDGTLLLAVDGGGVCRSMALHGSRVALGGLDAVRVFEQRAPSREWQALGIFVIPGLHLATGLAWRPDGRRLAVGSLCGVVDVLELVEESAQSMPAPTAAGAGNDEAAAAVIATTSSHAHGPEDTALFARARALGYERGIQLLQAQGRLEAAVDAALDAGEFEYALRVCDLSLPRRLPGAHRRHARHLEVRGQYAEVGGD